MIRRVLLTTEGFIFTLLGVAVAVVGVKNVNITVINY